MIKAQILSRAGKSTGCYSNWYNLKNLDDNTLSSINWDQIEKWRECNDQETFICDSDLDPISLAIAKQEELQKWKDMLVYEEVPYTHQNVVSLRWVNSSKFVNGEQTVKARLVARGFQEDGEILKDSPTCTKESLRLTLNIISCSEWRCHSIDIKSAFLQGNKIGRVVFVKPPKEANVAKTTI